MRKDEAPPPEASSVARQDARPRRNITKVTCRFFKLFVRLFGHVLEGSGSLVPLRKENEYSSFNFKK